MRQRVNDVPAILGNRTLAYEQADFMQAMHVAIKSGKASRPLGFLEGKGWQYSERLSMADATKLHDVCMKNHGIFFYGIHDLGKHSTHKMRINTTDEEPVFEAKHGYFSMSGI
eukprot:TRINITY_DN7474_c0_g4_i1.p1 TRINITY_DN7474_c0_g4~~TRINITY_DN7474_c0_g4_i1.p1  ORF type:complete len:113 (+),score=4.07 TRINITY_DN7474_c0_g4_i1:581-919(+)